MSNRRGSHSSWWKQRSIDGQGQQRPQSIYGNWWGISPVDGTHNEPPAKTIAHKYLRILKRLVKGEELRRVGKFWKWVKNSGGKVKATLLFTMRSLGLAHCINGRWFPTATGRQQAQS